MGNIYSAKFMHEFTNTLDSKVFQTPVHETYLLSTIKALNEMNAIIDEKTKKLYIQISEAESKQDENKIFAEYFYQFKSIFNEFSNKLQQMKTRMSMSIENKVETWKDLYEDDSYISNFDRAFSYTGYNFTHIEESDYPRLNLYKIYQKEFDYIGQLMQDTSMNASPSVRLKIIASVCNNFAGASKDKNWIKNLIQDMVDIDEKEITRSYSECIYNALRDKYEINVDKGMLYTCKENLSDYEDVIDAASKLCDDLLYELDKVAENISSYLFRNQDNKLKIKTDTDGIIDRDYRLDSYSMNQLDLFMKNKIRQMKKVLNVFAIAVGIKFDTAVDYIEQNIEILKTAKMYDPENTGEPEIEEDVENNDDDFEGDDDHEETPDEDDFEGAENHEEEPESEETPDEDDFDDDDFEFGGSDDEGKEMIEEEPEETTEPTEESEPSSDEPIEQDSEEFSEAYLFEAELFELEMMVDEYEMYMSISEALLLEGDPPAGNGGGGGNSGGNNGGNNSGGNSGGNDGGNNSGGNNQQNNNQGQNNQNNSSNVKKLANKAGDPNWFQRIIAKIKELWEKFKKKFLDKTKEKVEFLKNNKKYIFGKKVTAQAGLKYTPRFNLDQYLGIPDLNYNDANMQKNLDDDDTFIQAYFSQFYKDLSSDDKDLGLADAIKKTILGDAQETTNADKLKTSVEDAYNYCMKHESYVNRINNTMNILYKAEKVAKDISKVDGETIEDDNNSSQNEASYYFMEFDGAKVTKDNTKVNRVKRYFNICARALAAYMTVCDNLFAEMYEYCKWYVQTVRSGGAASNNQGDGNNGGNQGDGNNGGNQGDGNNGGNNGGNQGDGNNGGNQGGNKGQGSSSTSRNKLQKAGDRIKQAAQNLKQNYNNKKNNKNNKKNNKKK